MDYMGWILIAVSVAGLYVLGLISYRQPRRSAPRKEGVDSYKEFVRLK